MTITFASSLQCETLLRGRSHFEKSVSPVRTQSTHTRRRGSRLTRCVDELVRTLSANGDVSARVITGTDVVAVGKSLHSTSAVSTTALGRALLCSLLLAAGKKDGDTLQMQWRADGPLGGVTAIATGGAHARGYVGDPRTTVPRTQSGELNVPLAVGRGVLAVVRNSVYAKQPYTGLVRISSGEIAEDVATYLTESEQVPSAISAGVRLGADGSVKCAGGFLVQLLPGASEESIATLERNVRDLPPVTDLIMNGSSALDIVQRLMLDLEPMQVLSSDPKYACSCDVDRLKRTISLLPEEEIKQVLQEQKKIEATCEFCGKVYALSDEQVQGVLKMKK